MTVRTVESGEEIGEGNQEQESLCTPNSQEKGVPPSASSLVLGLTIVRKVKLGILEAELLAGTEISGHGIPCPQELLKHTRPHLGPLVGSSTGPTRGSTPSKVA